MWFLLVVAALAQPWEHVVARLASPVEARWTPEEARPALAGACDAGHTAACRLELGEGLATVLASACAAGDDASCLGHGWLIRDDRPGQAFELFERLCADGRARACVAVADARFRGHGTWGSRRKGRVHAEALCGGGVGDACVLLADMEGSERPEATRRHLLRALDLGASGASGRLAELAVGSERAPALEQACRAGHPGACWTLAAEGRGDPVALSRRACGLGVEAACVAEAALALDAGRVGVPGALRIVDRHCANDVGEACIAARFYRNGGSPPAFPTGRVGPVLVAMTVDEKVPDLLACYRGRLDRGDTSVAPFHLEVATDAEGRFLAVSGHTGDPTLEQCFADAFLGRPGQRPEGGPARFALEVTLTHEANIDVQPVGDDVAGGQITQAEWRFVSQLGLDVNACYLELGGSVFDRQFAILRGTLRSTGWYVQERVVESSGDDATDACVVALLERLRLPEVDLPFDQPVQIRIDFNRLGRAPRWARWGTRAMGVPPLDLSRHNHAATSTLSVVE